MVCKHLFTVALGFAAFSLAGLCSEEQKPTPNLEIKNLYSEKPLIREGTYWRFVEERNAYIKGLIGILKDEKADEEFFGPKHCSVMLLKEYRAVEAVDALLANLLFVPKNFATRERLRREDFYVCAGALVKIGAPCLPALYLEMAKTGKKQRELLAWIAMEILGREEAIAVLQIQKTKADKDTKALFDAAIKYVEDWKPVFERPAQAEGREELKDMEQNRNPHAERYAELEKNIREHIKGEMKTIKVLRLPKNYLEACNAKITDARRKDRLTVVTNYDGAARKRVSIRPRIFENTEGAIRHLVGNYADANAPKDIIDRALSAKYGDACFARTNAKTICFLRGNVVVTVWGRNPDAVAEAAKAFDAAIEASADLPAAKDGAKFEYPKEMLTENATKPGSFFRKGADEDPTASYIRTWSIAYFRQLKKFIDNYSKNWDKETGAARVAFCKLAAATRAKDAVPLLVKHIDFWHLGDSPFTGRPRDILEDRVALEALIEIGMPSLEPAFAHIVQTLDKLPKKETDDSRHQAAFLHAALKELPTKILGKDLAVAYLKMKLEDKDLSEKARAAIESTLSEIRPPEEKADKPDSPAPSEPEGKPEE